MSNLEQEQELEFLFEGDEDTLDVSEQENDDEEVFTDENDESNYGERFYEVASRETELSHEFESGIGDVLDDMEREYFWGGLKKLAKKGLKKLRKRAVQIAGGNLKGLLKNAAKMGLNSLFPGSGVALSALGLEVSDDKEAWDGFADLSRESFENLADEFIKNPGLSSQSLGALTNIASRAFNQAITAKKGGKGNGRIRRIVAHKGDTIVIKYL